jgi:acyl-CoA synthetase (AMP-forming)/AMP-acid ligase II
MEYNLADLWECVADTVPDREAFIYGELRHTYSDSENRINRLAHYLLRCGVAPGDRVALYLFNGNEYLEAMIAAFKIRAVPVNVNYRYVEEELSYLLNDSSAVALIFHASFASKIDAIKDRIPATTFIWVEDAHPDDGLLEKLGAIEYETALSNSSPVRDFGPRTADDLYILYTGGTTGMPKGVMWRHEDIFFGAFGGGDFDGRSVTTPEEIADKAKSGRLRCLPACPFMHGTAHWIAFTTLFSGGTVVISKDRAFHPLSLWSLIAQERVNLLVIVGDAFARPLVEALNNDVEADAVSCCTVILSGGAILSPAVKTALTDRLPGTMIIDGYGASETGGQGRSVTVAGSEPSARPRFRVNSQTMVLTEEFLPAEPGVVGLLARRGHVPIGYLGDPVKSAATFPIIDGVRWSVPGDHAVVEEDGLITLLGRGSVSINTGGEKVYPEEVESALKAHAGIFDALVVGLPDEKWGERVVAVLHLRSGVALDDAAINAHLRSHLAGYKIPRSMYAAPAIHRSPSGKPDYRWAKEFALAALSENEGTA